MTSISHLSVRPFSGGFSVEKMSKQTAEQKAQTYTGEVDPDIDEAGAPARGKDLDGFIDAGGGQPQKQRRGHMLPAGNISPQACEEKAESGELREVGQLPQNELPFVTEYGEQIGDDFKDSAADFPGYFPGDERIAPDEGKVQDHKAQI